MPRGRAVRATNSSDSILLVLVIFFAWNPLPFRGLICVHAGIGLQLKMSSVPLTSAEGCNKTKAMSVVLGVAACVGVIFLLQPASSPNSLLASQVGAKPTQIRCLSVPD